MEYKGFIEELRSTMNNRQTHKYRLDLLLSWLYEFKFTDYPTAFELLGLSKGKGGYRFIREQVENGNVTRFNNKNLGDQVNLLRISAQGVKYLKGNGLIGSEAPYVRSKRLERNSTLLHHLGTQKAAFRVAKKLKKKSDWGIEIFWEPKIGEIQADAEVRIRYEDGEYGRIAIEFERTAKNRKRAVYTLKQHDRNIAARKCQMVLYRFDDDAVMSQYKRYFDAEAWENIVKDSRHQLKRKLDSYEPQYRHRIKFLKQKPG